MYFPLWMIVVVIKCFSVKPSEDDDKIMPEDSKVKSLSSTKGNLSSLSK